MEDSKLKNNRIILGLCENIISELKSDHELSLEIRDFAIKQCDYLLSLVSFDNE